ncbi:NADPH-dependent FMN reductase [Massilia sp. erpn]|uniref:NADPH-dependent FMN reductase n=1 Tax=Massilia sp. erpn TaxID=2738142 RepID=UPI002104DC63|nr:NADPH-dependent FMN reductase [Massilia sp. erpn]UTY59070.1 NADPH-dependent FMN reductase [Massilia sp. erpn]
MSILLLAGSPAIPSNSSRLLLHIGDQLAARGHRHSRLHIRDLPPRALLHGDSEEATIRRALAAVAAADALVIATPVYKAAYSGALKAFLDLLPQNGLANKYILPIATAGSQSHLLALDYALRPVLQALEAKNVLTSVFCTTHQLQWNDDSGLNLAPTIAVRVQAGVEELSGLLRQTRPAGASVHAVGPHALPARSLRDHPYNAGSQAA